MTRTTRWTAAVVCAGAVSLGVSACGGGSSGSAAGAAATTKTGGGSPSSGAVQLPDFPVPAVPDVTSLTKQASQTESAIKATTPLPQGLSVTGARCDSSGTVVNRGGVTSLDGDGGGAVVSGSGTKLRNKDGSGTFTDADVTYSVDKDGSGEVTSGSATLQVDADGSGQYQDGNITYQVDADGSGQYQTGGETYQVDADGSGQWETANGDVVNDGDGSGTWVSKLGTVTVNGDGTGTLNADDIKIAAMPKFALLGKLPKLTTLRPLGKACGTLIRINASVLFDFDKATLRPAAGPVLAAVAKALATTKTGIQVNGYTDAIGSDSYNLDLSNRRAAAVVAALKADGLSAPLQPQGFGEANPIAPNSINGKDNPAGRQLNRRVELVIP